MITAQKVDQIVSENKASQDNEELRELLTLLSERHFKRVLEVGVHQGYSLLNWKKAFNPSVLVGIEWDIHALDIEMLLRIGAEVARGNSNSFDTYTQVARKYDKFDFLFIDGDHKYEAVKRDFELYAPLVKKGGIIVLHDVALKDNPEVEVYKFWQELTESEPNFNLIHENGTGYGVIFR